MKAPNVLLTKIPAKSAIPSRRDKHSQNVEMQSLRTQIGGHLWDTTQVL